MPSHITLAAAFQWAFNLVASGVMWTFLSQLVKTKSDAKYQVKQLAIQTEQMEAQKRQAERDDVRDDSKLKLDTERHEIELRKAEDERRQATETKQKDIDARADKQYKDACESRDYWKGECKAAQTELDGRNAKWVENNTSYPEVAALIAIPGAVQCLRDLRDKHLSQKP